MIIPYQELSKEALDGLIEEFVTWPGTDTGYTRNTLKQNVDMAKRQLRRGEIVISMYCPRRIGIGHRLTGTYKGCG